MRKNCGIYDIHAKNWSCHHEVHFSIDFEKHIFSFKGSNASKNIELYELIHMMHELYDQTKKYCPSARKKEVTFIPLIEGDSRAYLEIKESGKRYQLDSKVKWKFMSSPDFPKMLRYYTKLNHYDLKEYDGVMINRDHMKPRYDFLDECDQNSDLTLFSKTPQNPLALLYEKLRGFSHLYFI